MAKLNHVILCDAIGTGQGKKTLYGLFSTISAPQFPCIHPHCCLALEFSANDGDHELALTIVNSQGEDIIPPPPVLHIRNDNPMGLITVDINLNGLRFERPGIYTIQLFLDGQPLGGRDFFVESTGTR